MPNRDYYLREGAQFDTYRAAYRTYMITMQRLAGIPDPEAKADAIIALERRIAEAHWTPERNRDVTQSINPMTPAQLQELAAAVQLAADAEQPGFDQRPEGHRPPALRDPGRGPDVRRSAAADLEGLAYLPLHPHQRPVSAAAPSTRPISNSIAHTLRGQERSATAGSAGLGVLNGALGEAVGKIYVERPLPRQQPPADDRAGRRSARRSGDRPSRQQLDGRGDPQPQAIAKLDAFDPRIGNPVRYIDYSSIRVDPHDLLGNVLRAAEFQWNLQLSRYPNPVDRSLWSMTPQTINAYYSPLTNQITFPAAILQPPFFNPTADRRSITARSAR
jgi:endothelin-converting enzyme/putative endopeptidase